MTPSKITQGANDRARDASIAQTGSGLPDDTGSPVEIGDGEAARIEQSIRAMGQDMPSGPDVPYDVESVGRPPGHKGKDSAQDLKDRVQDDIDLPLKGSA